MSELEFDNGYWYADQIKEFAKEIGVKSTNKLRKDELEDLIKHYLRTGETIQSKRRTNSNVKKDIEVGLRLDLPIRHYTSNKITKNFIVNEAFKIKPDLKQKSGARYRLNRWREEQLAEGKQITYGDLVHEYIRLNQHEGSFKQARSGRYINFLANFMADNPSASREEAISTWKELKNLDIPKTYADWKKYSQK